MKLKLYGGTAKGDENLCKDCRHAHRRRYANSNEEVTICQAVWERPEQVSGPVAECSSYKRDGETTLEDMKSIAWHISTDKRNGKIGFLDAKAAHKAIKEGKLDDVEDVEVY
jgi:primase-polymerase (primpol)-like protein